MNKMNESLSKKISELPIYDGGMSPTVIMAMVTNGETKSIDSRKLRKTEWSITNESLFLSGNNKGIWCDTSINHIDIYLPSALIFGNVVIVGDYSGNCSTNNIRLFSDSKINGSYDPLIIKDDNAVMYLVWVDDIVGWKIIRYNIIYTGV